MSSSISIEQATQVALFMANHSSLPEIIGFETVISLRAATEQKISTKLLATRITEIRRYLIISHDGELLAELNKSWRNRVAVWLGGSRYVIEELEHLDLERASSIVVVQYARTNHGIQPMTIESHESTFSSLELAVENERRATYRLIAQEREQIRQFKR